MTRKVALITGASSGIGQATACRLQSAGLTVYAAARRVDRLAELVPSGVRTIALDVTEDDSATKAVNEILAAEGRIDVLVNNAGYGSYGALEEVPMSEARAQIEVNLFGLAHLTQLVLPAMRAQGTGTVVNISSMGGRFATPLGSWYHASKYAVEGLSDAMRLELRHFGINVVLIEPGLIRTDWGAIAAERLRTTSGHGPYAEQATHVAESLERGSQPDAPMSSPASVIAEAVAKAVTARRPRTRYRVGYGARPLIFLSRILPDRVFDAVITRSSGA